MTGGFVLVAAAQAVDISACGATIPAGDTGRLVADLDCTGQPFGIRVLRGGTLGLEGHRIKGGQLATVAGVKIAASANELGRGRGSFTILGPGEIDGGHEPIMCLTQNGGDLVVDGGTGIVDIHDCNETHRATRSYPNRGQLTFRKVLLRNHYGSAGAAKDITATDTTMTNVRGIGFSASRRLTLTRVAADHVFDSGAFFAGKEVIGSDVDVQSSSVGVTGLGAAVRLTRYTATANNVGVYSAKVSLTDSTVTGNEIDIISGSLPVLVNTTCGTATNNEQPPVSWPVCGP